MQRKIGVISKNLTRGGRLSKLKNSLGRSKNRIMEKNSESRKVPQNEFFKKLRRMAIQDRN